MLRRLRQEWAEAREQVALREEMRSATRSMAERFDELSALVQSTTIDPRAIKRREDYGTIVKAAGKHIASGSSMQFVIWKTCSAMAHGDVRGAVGYLTKETLSEISPGVPLVQITCNVPLLTTGALAAIETVRLALSLYGKRSTATAA